METVIAYFDETGDDGLVNSSSQDFVLTSIYTKQLLGRETSTQ